MPQARSEKRSAQDILGQLEAYEKLREACQRYASLKENVEKERDSVQPHIYEKVRAEYADKMLALEQDLKKQKALLQENLSDLLQKRAELDRLCRKDTERLEEIDFRTRVGEFAAEECKEERKEIEQRTLSQSNELARLEEIVNRCTRGGLLKEESSPGTASDPEERKQGAQQAANESPTAGQEADEPQPPEPVEAAEDFEILEEEPHVDDQEAPVVHCPPSLSSVGSKARKDASSTSSRTGATADASDYVTGYLIALEGSRKGERFPMISSNITLGNSPGIDIRLSDAGIANFHARILYKERKHFLENLDSMGRSFVNGVQAANVVELKDGDVIRLGDIKMQVEYASANTNHPS
jgi:hypothetical protein